MYWYLKVLQEYTNFQGRARRTEYWMFILINLLFSLGFLSLDILILDHNPLEPTDIAILQTIYSLAVLLPTIAVSVRRLHDTNRSGWWVLIAFLPGLLGGFISGLNIVSSSIQTILSLVTFVGIIVLIVFFATEGHRGPNQYGPDPKNPVDHEGREDNYRKSDLHTDWD